MDASFSSPPSCTPPPLPRASARSGLRVALLIDHRLQETALLTFRLRVIIRSQQLVSRQARGNCCCRSLLPQKPRSAARKGSWKRDDVRFKAKLYLLLHVYCLLTKLPRPRDKNERTCLRVKLPPVHRPPSTRHSETATCPPPTIYQTRSRLHILSLQRRTSIRKVMNTNFYSLPRVCLVFVSEALLLSTRRKISIDAQCHPNIVLFLTVYSYAHNFTPSIDRALILSILNGLHT